MIQLSFQQTRTELMLRTATTLIFNTLKRSGATLAPLQRLIQGTQYGYTASASDKPIGPRFVRITDLKDGKIDWPKVPYCGCTKVEQYKLNLNDVLFARTGATTGKTLLVTALPPESAVFASYLIRIRPKPDVHFGYLSSFFLSDLYWEQIVEHKEGSAQANVNGEKLCRLQVPITDQRLQKAIAQFVEVISQQNDHGSIELPDLPAPLADLPPLRIQN